MNAALALAVLLLVVWEVGKWVGRTRTGAEVGAMP